ncbi:MAG TPA: helix-turn-helix domain-containing protein [Luteolibacter sp.]
MHQVIDHLKRARVEKRLSLEEVARRAQVKRHVISMAEQQGNSLNSRDFKAWTSALGLSWNQVWSDCFPGNRRIPSESAS